MGIPSEKRTRSTVPAKTLTPPHSSEAGTRREAKGQLRGQHKRQGDLRQDEPG